MIIQFYKSKKKSFVLRSMTAGFICLLFFTTCGLEDVPFLPPPAPQPNIDSQTLVFFTPDLQGDSVLENRFRGIEIYYKFYIDENSIPEEEQNITLQSNLISYRYYRLVTDKDELDSIDIPLIEVPIGDRGSQHKIVLNFTVPAFPGDVSTSDYKTISLRRGGAYYTDNKIVDINGNSIEGNFHHFKRFSDLTVIESTTDINSDLAGFGTLEAGNHLTIAFYAVSYGKDGLTTIYSQPVRLNPVTVAVTNREIAINP